MCRILVYGCGNVNFISTEGAETLISCTHNKNGKDCIKTVAVESEILVSHNEFPEYHKLVFIQTVQKVEQEAEDVEEPHAEHVAMIESFIVKEEPIVQGSSKDLHLNEIKEENPGIADKELSDGFESDVTSDLVECPRCSKVFNSINGFNSHMRRQDDEYKCNFCCEEFDDIAKFRLHKGIKGKTYSCNNCPKTFSQQCKLMRHNRCHGWEKPFECALCSRSFKQLHILRYHMQTHSTTRKRNFKCTRCPKAYFTQKAVRKHEKTGHVETKDFICDICGKAFGAKENLSIHTKKVHENQRNYKCTVCDRRFSKTSGLSEHMMIHRGEKNFKCTHCDKRFIRKHSAQKHIELHAKYGDKKFSKYRKGRYD